jgi:Tfp pilus assembly protein PilZ
MIRSVMPVVTRENRMVMRHAIEVPCQIVRERDMKLLGTRTVDLSAGGLLLPSEMDVDIGEDVMVSFRATTFGLLFATSGSVARVLDVRRAKDKQRCVGVHFELPALSRHYLRGALRRVPPPLPKRPRQTEKRIDYAATIRKIAEEGRIDRFFFD